MSRTRKDRNKRIYRRRKSAIYSKYLHMWWDDFPRKLKDKNLSKQVRRKKEKEDKKIIKEYFV